MALMRHPKSHKMIPSMDLVHAVRSHPMHEETSALFLTNAGYSGYRNP